VLALQSADTRLCTAVKIGERMLMTAAHCVVNSETGRLKPSFRPGGELTLTQHQQQAKDKQRIEAVIARTHLPEAYQQGLARFRAYRKTRLAQLQQENTGLPQRTLERGLRMRHHFPERYPDIALLTLTSGLPEIPSLGVNLQPLLAGDEVTLVGFGCALGSTGLKPARGMQRRWGRSRVIRVDALNFYTEAGQRRDGAPSLCPGDSGGPVLRDGLVVGLHTVVYGLNARQGARSNMAVNLAPLADWKAWPTPASAARAQAERPSQ
jgi:hypothetical protein